VSGHVEAIDADADVESAVRSYARRWPVVFTRAEGSVVWDEEGVPYLDFFAAAGSLNYGHNPPVLIKGLVDYLRSSGPLCTLDMATTAKRAFLTALRTHVLEPRGLNHVVQFTSPSGASAVEAALRLARKVTGRRRVISLTGAFHGMSLDAIAVSDLTTVAGRPTLSRAEYTVAPHESTTSTQTALDALEAALFGDEPSAALILEVVQGEGGARPISDSFLTGASHLCAEAEALLIVDDVQAGCGRTGTFFSFEPSAVQPDLICLAKSISGCGLPLAVLLIDPRHDRWEPGEHSGTFRGNDLAFVTAAIAIDQWWTTPTLSNEVHRKSARLVDMLERIAARSSVLGRPQGRGLLLGLPCMDQGVADRLSRRAFERGLLVETCGPDGSVLKISPPLTVLDDEMALAASILQESINIETEQR
jgi:diaminobutyrate-2-oxoglutarate transaminase